MTETKIENKSTKRSTLYKYKNMRYEYQWDNYPPQVQRRWMRASIGNCMAFNNDKNACMILIENTDRECVKETSTRQKSRKQPNATNGSCHHHSEIISHPVAGFSLHQDISKCIFLYDVFFQTFCFSYMLCWWPKINMILLTFTLFCRQTNDDFGTQLLCVKCEELKKTI